MIHLGKNFYSHKHTRLRLFSYQLHIAARRMTRKNRRVRLLGRYVVAVEN